MNCQVVVREGQVEVNPTVESRLAGISRADGVIIFLSGGALMTKKNF